MLLPSLKRCLAFYAIFLHSLLSLALATFHLRCLNIPSQRRYSSHPLNSFVAFFLRRFDEEKIQSAFFFKKLSTASACGSHSATFIADKWLFARTHASTHFTKPPAKASHPHLQRQTHTPLCKGRHRKQKQPCCVVCCSC